MSWLRKGSLAGLAIGLMVGLHGALRPDSWLLDAGSLAWGQLAFRGWFPWLGKELNPFAGLTAAFLWIWYLLAMAEQVGLVGGPARSPGSRFLAWLWWASVGAVGSSGLWLVFGLHALPRFELNLGWLSVCAMAGLISAICFVPVFRTLLGRREPPPGIAALLVFCNLFLLASLLAGESLSLAFVWLIEEIWRPTRLLERPGLLVCWCGVVGLTAGFACSLVGLAWRQKHATPRILLSTLLVGTLALGSWLAIGSWPPASSAAIPRLAEPTLKVESTTRTVVWLDRPAKPLRQTLSLRELPLTEQAVWSWAPELGLGKLEQEREWAPEAYLMIHRRTEPSLTREIRGQVVAERGLETRRQRPGLTGRLELAGKPLVGARVRALMIPEFANARTIAETRLDLECAERLPGDVCYEVTRTDTDGRFDFYLLEPDLRYLLAVRFDGAIDYQVEHGCGLVLVDPKETLDLGTLRLR